MKSKKKLSPWLRPRGQASTTTVAVGWYTADDWRKVKDASVDAERFEETYSAWTSMAEDAIRSMSAVGLVAEKFHVNAEELLVWCMLHGKKNDASARAEFVSRRGLPKAEGAA